MLEPLLLLGREEAVDERRVVEGVGIGQAPDDAKRARREDGQVAWREWLRRGGPVSRQRQREQHAAGQRHGTRGVVAAHVSGNLTSYRLLFMCRLLDATASAAER